MSVMQVKERYPVQPDQSDACLKVFHDPRIKRWWLNFTRLLNLYCNILLENSRRFLVNKVADRRRTIFWNILVFCYHRLLINVHGSIMELIFLEVSYI